jgi:hypothetical protein
MSEAPDGGMRTATDPTDQPLTEQYSKGWRRAPGPAIYLLCGDARPGHLVDAVSDRERDLLGEDPPVRRLRPSARR